MKKLSALLIGILFVATATASAQVVPLFKFELGTSVSYYNLKFDDDTESIDYLNIPVRFGWYFWKGFEIEPEVQIFLPMTEGGEVAYLLQGHLLYNFSLGGIVPFIGGGAGIGNGVPFYGVIEGGTDYKSSVYVGMAGIKFMIGNSAAIRLEYRFNRFSWETPFTLEKEWGNLHNVLVGVSVFF